MAKHRKKLLIFSLDPSIGRFLFRTVHDVIGHEVKIDVLSSGQKMKRRIKPDLIMLSNEGVRQEAAALFPHTPVLVPTRIITCFNLEKLLRLPGGKKVLLVNDPEVAARDTLTSLISFGIDHLDYIPYWSGNKKTLRGIDTAVSPGMTHLVPAGIKVVIDIGPRTVSTYSFLCLLEALKLDPVYLEKFSNSYHNLLIESSRKLTAALDRSEILRRHMEVIFDEFEDGLMSVNEDGTIDRANSSVGRLLDTDRKALARKNIYALLEGFEKLADLVEDSDNGFKSAGIYSYKNHKILINKIPVLGSNMKSHIFTFREIERIREIEENVRIKLSQNGYLSKYDRNDIWSRSETMATLLSKAENFAKSGMNILITGESGTGKELFAHLIHRSSDRRGGPFVAVNFAGLSETLIESELFGYEEGAFTGAKRGGKRGLFEQAHGGTIFLDEIGDAPITVQARLLRVIQEKEVMRVGGSKIVPVSVRVIAATNTDLMQAMLQKRFREDLYYRINTLELKIPPLRERKEDVIYIISKYLKDKYKISKTMPSETVDCMMSYDWPGNVRELINTAEYICYSSEGKMEIALNHLPENLTTHYRENLEKNMKAERDEFSRMKNHLYCNAYSEDIVFRLLSVLKERKNKICGRNSLKRAMLERDMVFTEGNIKHFLKTLRDIDLVSVGTTKQGTTITPKGEKFLYYLSMALD